MDVTGKVIQHLDKVTGESSRGPWQKQEFIIETPGDYPKKVCLSLWGDKVNILPAIGNTVAVSVNLESREYNGRWYTEARAWKIDAPEGSAPQANQSNNANVQSASNKAMVEPQNSSNNEEDDDLPF